MLITNEMFKHVRDVQKRLRHGESVSLREGRIVINAEPKNRSDARRISALRRKYEKPLQQPKETADESGKT